VREDVDVDVLQVIHPRCCSAITIDSLAVTSNGAVSVDGLCYHCERYVHLTFEMASSAAAPLMVSEKADATRLALRRTRGNVSAAARLLGIHRSTMAVRITRYRLSAATERARCAAK
jgi:transcriptional regulator of acetoin/glycerol metabolism